MRCLALARALRDITQHERDTEVAFACREGSMKTTPALARSGFPVTEATGDADFALPDHWNGRADAIFVDLYTSTAADETRMRDHAGIIMLAAVALFGLFTALFGISTMPWLSIAALALMGAADMISVYIRETLIQLWTPDRLRGRVSAVNMVFVGASNELGEFRAGTMAAGFGAVPAVVIGGAGAIGVAALWGFLFPAMRRARHLDGRT